MNYLKKAFNFISSNLMGFFFHFLTSICVLLMIASIFYFDEFHQIIFSIIILFIIMKSLDFIELKIVMFLMRDKNDKD